MSPRLIFRDSVVFAILLSFSFGTGYRAFFSDCRTTHRVVFTV